MKFYKVIAFVIPVLFSISAIADVSVDPYYRKDGTYVPQHYRSDPNNNTNDNWSTKGNTNPYTGKEGTNKRDSNSWGN